MDIRGEYWIVDGRAEYADGDNGDKNHEMIAREHVCAENLGKLYNYAKRINVQSLQKGSPAASKVHYNSLEDDPVEGAKQLLKDIYTDTMALSIVSKTPLNQVEAWQEIISQSGIERDAFLIMAGGEFGGIPSGDSRLYVMKKEGWVAVRNNNIELYGLDQNKLKSISSGLDDVVDQETEGIEEVNDEDIEFNLFDHKNGKSIDVTLKDIKENNIFRPQRLPQTKYNTILFASPDKKGFLGSQSPRALDARSKSLSSTSESFKAWFHSVENGANMPIYNKLRLQNRS